MARARTLWFSSPNMNEAAPTSPAQSDPAAGAEAAAGAGVFHCGAALAALIVDKYGSREMSPAQSQEPGQRCPAANEAQAIA